MISEIMQGNADKDGEGLRHWFVGDIEAWCNHNTVEFDDRRFQLRNTKSLEIKWQVHKKGEERVAGWSPCSSNTTISILVRGSFSIRFRDPEDTAKMREYKLQAEGDYILWRENVEHTWKAEDESLIITVRWKSSD